MHAAAATADYDAVNALIGCGASRVACHDGPGPRDPAEAASFDYAMTIGDAEWVMRVNSCAWAYGLDEAWCARDLTSPNEQRGDRLYGADLCGNQPLVWVVLTKLRNSLARSHRRRFG